MFRCLQVMKVIFIHSLFISKWGFEMSSLLRSAAACDGRSRLTTLFSSPLPSLLKNWRWKKWYPKCRLGSRRRRQRSSPQLTRTTMVNPGLERRATPDLMLILFCVQNQPGFFLQSVTTTAERSVLEPQPALETIQSLHCLDGFQSGWNQSQPGGSSGRSRGRSYRTARPVFPQHRPAPWWRPAYIESGHTGQHHGLCQQGRHQI